MEISYCNQQAQRLMNHQFQNKNIEEVLGKMIVSNDQILAGSCGCLMSNGANSNKLNTGQQDMKSAQQQSNKTNFIIRKKTLLEVIKEMQQQKNLPQDKFRKGTNNKQNSATQFFEVYYDNTCQVNNFEKPMDIKINILDNINNLSEPDNCHNRNNINQDNENDNENSNSDKNKSNKLNKSGINQQQQKNQKKNIGQGNSRNFNRNEKNNQTNLGSNQNEFKILEFMVELIYVKENQIAILLFDMPYKQRANMLEISQKKYQLFMSQTSHDIRNNLNAIMEIIAVNETIQDPEQTTESLKTIKKICNHAVFILRDILDYSNILNNKLKVQKKEFNILNTVKDIIDIEQYTNTKPNVTLQAQINLPLCELKIQNDENRLKQILMNLISNSLKFTENGYVEIQVNQSTTDDQLVEIIVRDTGIGIPKNILPKLFQAFQTFNLGGKNPQGTGLGLLIVKQLVRCIGPSESVIVESQESQGTTIKFQIFKNLMGNEEFTKKLSQFTIKLGESQRIKCQNIEDTGGAQRFQTPSQLTNKCSNKEPELKLSIELSLNQGEKQTNKDDPQYGKDRQSNCESSLRFLEYNPNLMPDSQVSPRNLLQIKVIRSLRLIESIQKNKNNTKINNENNNNNNNNDNNNNNNDNNNNININSSINVSSNINVNNNINSNNNNSNNNNASSPHVINQSQFGRAQCRQEKVDSLTPKSNNKNVYLNSLNSILFTDRAYKVLIVDDNKFNKFAFRQILQQIKNLQIQEGSNGQEAVDIVENQNKSEPIEFLFIDYNMPVMDGIQATKIIKDKVKLGLLKNIKIILKSADAEQERDTFIQAGGDEICPQPLTFQSLYELFKKLC